MYEVNVIGLMLVTRALLPALKASGAGVICNVGSTAGRIAYEGGAVFTRDGDYLANYRDHDAHRREFARFSVRDAEAYDRYSRDVTRQCRFIQPFLMRTAPDPTSLKPRDLGELIYLGKKFSGLGAAEMAQTLRFWTMSIADFLDEYFETDVIKANFSISGIIGTALGPMSPGTAYVLLHHYMGEVDGSVGAWGYARGASDRGVHIIQNCEVTGIRRSGNGQVTGVETSRGFIGAKKVGVVAAGNTSVVMQMADVRMPLESFPLQALVSEPVKPCFPCVVMSNTVHAYISQSDKGELVIGAGTDQYTSYSQTGGLHIIQHTLDAICEMFPIFTRMRMLRSWGGIVDVTPDRSPIIAKTPVSGLYVNCGWGTGGFKATPGSGHVFAHTIANDNPHPINAGYTMERFTTGRLIDEAAAAAVAH